MTSNSTSNLDEHLNQILFWIGHFILIIQMVFGTFGNLLNIIIFTRRALRNNSCSMYFLIVSISNLLEIYIVTLFNHISTSWNWIPANTNIVWCKINGFLTYPLIALGLWFIVLCSFDRYLTSSHNANIRKKSTLSLAKKMTFSTMLFFFIIFGHLGIIIRPFTIDDETYCTVLSSTYIIFYNILFVIVGNVLPIILMAIFGILTVLNIRKIHINVVPLQINNITSKRIHSKDQQLIRMLLFQVLITVLISIPYCCINMYQTFAQLLLRQHFSSSESAIIYFIDNLLAMIHLTNSVIGFYIYTLTGHKFREELKRCFQYGLKIIFTACYLPLKIQQALFSNKHQRRNHIHPIEQQQPVVLTTAV
ncbi:unnamed protein product [Adineta ricciae]|uniref:G-protein coupled receptors family 1 profile domain-containing protein n=1 Tax=Adineta ricciae TaxID=249248 RepID=A0A815PPC7_ADIRI|nr:unnamed protein product [Adineta ricciae]